jgi:hypothetical protein
MAGDGRQRARARRGKPRLLLALAPLGVLAAGGCSGILGVDGYSVGKGGAGGDAKDASGAGASGGASGAHADAAAGGKGSGGIRDGGARPRDAASGGAGGAAGSPASGGAAGARDASVMPDAGGPPVPTCPPLQALNAAGSCEPVGVTSCPAPGFKADANGGCTAILPAARCALGALPGQAACSSSFICDTSPPRVQTNYVAPIYYARPAPAGSPGADGSIGRPFATIREALAAKPQPATILLYDGDFAENVDVAIPVVIRGVCPQMTRIVGRAPSPAAGGGPDAGSDAGASRLVQPATPVVRFGAGSDGSMLNGVAVTGDLSQIGISIDHASRVQPLNTWIHDVRFGVAVEESTLVQIGGLTGGVILIEKVAERGIVVRGSSVTIKNAMVRDAGSPTLSPALESAAIAVHPSRHCAHGGNEWDPWTSVRSDVTVTNSVLERAPVGILVEGSTARVSGTVVRDTDQGVVAKWRGLGAIGGDVTIDQSIIEGSRDMGVQVWNARAEILNTTIRSTGGPCPPGSAGRPVGAFPGNGVRARFDRVPSPPAGGVPAFDPASQEVTIAHSLVDASHQAGVHVEGGALTLDHTLVRGTLPEVCTGALGDGVMAYSHAGFPIGSARVETSRISGSAGPGIATFGTPLTLAGSEIDGPAIGIARDAPSVPISGAATCGVSGAAARCVPEDGKAQRSLAVDCAGVPHGRECIGTCIGDLFGGGAVPAGVWVGEALREPRFPPVVMDADGCFWLSEGEDHRVYETACFGDLYPPGMTLMTADPLSTYRAGPSGLTRPYRAVVAVYGIQGLATLIPDYALSEIDLSYSQAQLIVLCPGPPPAVDGGAPVPLLTACPTGAQGWGVEVSPMAAEARGPFPTTEQGVAVKSLNGARGGALWNLMNVPPGDYAVRLVPPAGTTGRCTGDGVPTDGTGLHFLLRAEPGFASAAAVLFCTTTP